MSGVVVYNKLSRPIGLDHAEERGKFDGAVAQAARADRSTGGHVEGCGLPFTSPDKSRVEADTEEDN